MLPSRVFETGELLRSEIRAGRFAGQTAGQAPGFAQGNVVVLPLKYARDFLLFCLNNPKPCPLIGVSQPGDPTLPELGHNIDIRTDVPRYRVFRHGDQKAEVSRIEDLWSSDLVTFVLGCSFTFEESFMKEGYMLRHIQQGTNIPMFLTNIQTMQGGIFSGPLVVTMRPFPEKQIPVVFDISAQFTSAHGAPIYWGDPSNIGIADLHRPDFGDPVEVHNDEIPVFWACGVTPQVALSKARPFLSITHAPGCMLVTDLPSSVAPKVDALFSGFTTEIDEKANGCIAAA